MPFQYDIPSCFSMTNCSSKSKTYDSLFLYFLGEMPTILVNSREK